MLALMWAALLFANKGAAEVKTNDEFSVSLNGGNITGEAGLCVILPCSFTTEAEVKSIIWYKCTSPTKCDKPIFSSNNKKNVELGFKDRVSLLETDLSKKNCSIIITDLNMTDSGSYQLRVNDKRITSPPKANITVTELRQKPRVEIPSLTEGQETTLTCTAPALCSGSSPNITWTWRSAGGNDSHITGNMTTSKAENLTAVSQKHSSTLTFNPSAEHHGTEVTCKVSFTGVTATEETKTLNVTYVKELSISGNTAVKEGGTVNLTCSLDSFPATLIKWTKSGSNKNLHEENRNGLASLIIPNVTAEDSGLYTCTAKHQIRTLTEDVTITMKFPPRILNSSACNRQSEVLTCVCVSEGFPLPTIKWPLLENSTEYSVVTAVSNRRVSSSITVSVKGHSSTTECVSTNGIEQAKQKITITELQQEDLLTTMLGIVEQLPVIIVLLIGLLIGLLLSAMIACLARRCQRKKQKRSIDMAENLEMVTTQAVLSMDNGQAAKDGIHDQEASEERAECAGQSAPDGDVGPKELEYSNIDFSVMNRKNSTGAEATPDTTETEYAEIKKDDIKERQENNDMWGADEEKEVMIEEDKETKACMSGEGGEDVVLYSNLNEIMEEM